ncbi:hypothetical protein P7K49_011684, partial [Saguinus oedipus]
QGLDLIQKASQGKEQPVGQGKQRDITGFESQFNTTLPRHRFKKMRSEQTTLCLSNDTLGTAGSPAVKSPMAFKKLHSHTALHVECTWCRHLGEGNGDQPMDNR